MRTTPVALLLLLAACSNGGAPRPVTPSAAPAPHAGSAGPAPADAHAGPGAPKPAPTPPGELIFTTPTGWQVESPSQFRKLQFRLPRAEGDGEDAMVWVTDFGGGTREANFERWAAEFELPDGRPAKEAARQSTRKVGELEAFEVDVAGTCVARMAPNEPATMKKEGFRQIAVILEGGSKPWYVKVRGPSATIAKWEASFRAFVDSAHKAK